MIASEGGEESSSRSSSANGSAGNLSKSQTSAQSTVSTRRLGFGASLSDCEFLDDNVIISEITEIEPTAAILRYCKRRFLSPFFHILSAGGMRPNAVDPDCLTFVGHVQTSLMVFLLVTGYVLQFVTGFRRDRGFVENIPTHKPPAFLDPYAIHYQRLFDTGEVIFTYIAPAVLHFSGFAAAFYVYRLGDDEQLQSLVERVFILGAGTTPRHLVLNFWFYVGMALLWIIGSMTYIGLLANGNGDITVTNQYLPKLSAETMSIVKICLFITLFFHDLMQVIVIVSYSIHCFLLRSYLNTLKEKLLLHTIEPLDWMREIVEFRKRLHHLNTKISIPVCCLTILNISYTLSNVAHLFRDLNQCPVRLFSLSLANIFLWMTLSLMPFFQAASLTLACRSTQSCGHLISIRPFVHRHTSSEDLNTVLLYASSLKMSAKLFRMPIIAHYLCFALLLCAILILTFGMCINISMGIF